MSAMSDRQAFLAKIRRALGHDPEEDRSDAALFVTPEPSARTLPPDGSLLEQLTAAGDAMQTPVTAVSDPAAAAEAIARLAVESQPEWDDAKEVVCWDHPLVNALQIEKRLVADEIAVHTLCRDPSPGESAPPREAWRRIMTDAYIGITSALYCLADTATLVLQTAPGQPRAASLLPSIHVAVIHQSQIIADLKSLYRMLETDIRTGGDPLGNSLTMITGPSKTADIEATMVYGAHGPRALHIVVITEKDKKPLPSKTIDPET